MKITEPEREQLVRFHAITEMIIYCHILGKGNENAEKNDIKNFFKETIKFLLDHPKVLFIDIEEYICAIYNARNKTANPARAEIFIKKYSNENKIIDLLVLTALRVYITSLGVIHLVRTQNFPKK